MPTPEFPAIDESQRDPRGFRLRRFRNWISLGLTYATYYLCRYNLGTVAPEIKDAFGFDNRQYGAIQSAQSGAYGVGQFVNGLLTDKIGGRRALTIGAVGTVILNGLFGWAAWSSIGWLFSAMFIIRLADGYVQAFGAPGMVKINAAWFRRRERGTFAGVFGCVINLGHGGAGHLWSLLARGFSVPLIFFTITVTPLDWRYMFIVPPVIAAIMVILMNLLVRNHPEEAGYAISHDDESPEELESPIELRSVFKAIASMPIVWIVAMAYFCTGFVQGGILHWWTVYLDETWFITEQHRAWWWLAVVAIPGLAALGSIASGVVSDTLCRGRRAPVATILYAVQALCILSCMLFAGGIVDAGVVLSVAMLLGIHTGCNATHSVLGSAAPMDLGGRRMAGFAAGLINSLRYFGAMLAGFGIGWLLDAYPAKAPPGWTRDALPMDPMVWYASMLPSALLGTVLMGYVWRSSREDPADFNPD